MTSLLEVLPCVHLSSKELKETFSPGKTNNGESEGDSGVESLVELEIATNLVPEPPRAPPCVPFRPPLHRWISRDEEHNTCNASPYIPAIPAVPPCVPFRPPLHRWISQENQETEFELAPIEVVCRSATESYGEHMPHDILPHTCATCDIRFGNDTVQLPCCSSYVCVLCADELCPICGSNIDLYTKPAGNMLQCEVCYEENAVKNKRPCCSISICDECLYQMVVVNINDGVTSISCPNTSCDQLLLREEILAVLGAKQDLGTKDKYERFRLAKCTNNKEKVCPNCSWLTAIKTNKKPRRWKQSDIRITCEKCNLEWCFKCHAPWHKDISCKQFSRGNKDFRKWITGRDIKGNANGHRCPSCKIPIQRSTGCNNMTCSDCSCEFCYRCGYRLIFLPGILGDHYCKLGFAGCKYNYEPNNDIKRVSVRSGYLFTKVASVLGNPGLMLAGMGVLLVAGVVVIPIYGGYKLYRHHSAKKAIKRRRELTRQAALRRHN